MAKTTQQLSPTDYDEKWKNPMKRPFLEKLVLSIGVGGGGEELERAVAVLRTITGKEPKRTLSKKNVKEWDVRKGRPVGCKVTVRNEEAEKLLKRLLIVNNNKMLRESFDDRGNFGFGIKEHISIPGIEYDNAIGIYGLNVTGRIVRPGMRVQTRRIRRAKIPKDHYVSRDEAQYYLKKKFDIEIVEELELDYI
ncbi:MAG: 50S ribosomal protein L5 [Promethearchaeia archaeon]